MRLIFYFVISNILILNIDISSSHKQFVQIVKHVSYKYVPGVLHLD